MLPRPPISTLFPYTTLFRSLAQGQVAPGAFGEPHLLAALHYRHHLMQDVLGIPGRDAHAQRLQADAHPRDRAVMVGALHVRSEEHTSELQSRFDLVCRLLLE